MTIYELSIKTNEEMIKGKAFSDTDKLFLFKEIEAPKRGASTN